MTGAEGRVVIAGDLCAVPANAAAFERGDADAVFSTDLLDLLKGSSGVVLNLETPLTDHESPIVKSGPCLRSPVATASVLGELNLLAVGLANNHVLDQGPRGFADTLAALDGAGIAYLGGGANIVEARRPFVSDAGGRRVGFYACAEHEFTIAGGSLPGSNPFDALTAFDGVRSLAASCDAVVVLYHGMKEFYRYPSPEVRRRCRSLVDAGADFVACQHSHCIGCVEEYGGATILYGQGDFCFCKGDENPMRRDGLLALLDPATCSVEFVPVVNSHGMVSLATGDERDEILAGFNRRAVDVDEPGFVERSWGEFCEGLADEYAAQVLMAMEPRWLGKLGRLLRKLGCPVRLGSGRDVGHFLNMLQCEAHREVLETALRGRLNG